MLKHVSYLHFSREVKTPVYATYSRCLLCHTHMTTLLADFFIRHTRSAAADYVSDCFVTDNSKFSMLVVRVVFVGGC